LQHTRVAAVPAGWLCGSALQPRIEMPSLWGPRGLMRSTGGGVTYPGVGPDAEPCCRAVGSAPILICRSVRLGVSLGACAGTSTALLGTLRATRGLCACALRIPLPLPSTRLQRALLCSALVGLLPPCVPALCGCRCGMSLWIRLAHAAGAYLRMLWGSLLVRKATGHRCAAWCCARCGGTAATPRCLPEQSCLNAGTA
jgi:hypothetical protein